MLLTIKYGIPSAKYSVGIQLQGDLNCFIFVIYIDIVTVDSEDPRLPVAGTP